MIKIKKLLTMTLTALYCFTILPVNASSLNEKEDSKKPVITINDMSLEEFNKLSEEEKVFGEVSDSLSRAIGNTGVGDFTVPGVQIPNITIDGLTAYCLDMPKDFPVNLYYSDNGEYNGAQVNALLYHGYPTNASNLKGKYGLSDLQARRYTQYALWVLLMPSGTFKDRDIPYVNELLSLAKGSKVAPNEFYIHNNAVTFSEESKTQVSNVFTTSGSKGTFAFQSDDNVYSTDVNGNRKDTFNIGESFKVVAKGSVKGNITKEIKVSVERPVAELFIPSLDNYQRLIVPSYKTAYYTSSKTLSLNFNGIVEKGSITVKKTDENGNALSNVTFGLYSDSNCQNQLNKGTTSNGNVTFNDLEVGKTYYVKEISGITGYVTDSSIKEVKLNSSNETITVVNKKIYGQIEVVKTEEGNEILRLSGAEFEIYDASSNLVDKITTGENGVAVSKRLPFGNYTIKETKAPNGYNLNSSNQSVNIDTMDKIYSVTFKNSPIKGFIEIEKIDVENSSPLKGVKFGLYKSDDTLIEELITNENGTAKSSELRYGNYYVQEIEAIEGYNLESTKYPVSIIENGKVYRQTITNSKSYGKLIINKIDASSKEPIAGVLFNIKATSGFNKDKEWLLETNENGIIELEGLTTGNYEITEVKAAEGYILSTEVIKESIKKNGQAVEVTIENERIKGKFELLKYDDNSEEKNPLEGVKFSVKGIDGFGKEINFEFETDEKGLYTSDYLEYGTYEIVEIEAKEGYVLDATPILIHIKSNDELVFVTKANKMIFGGLDFIKIDSKDEDKTPIKGATIEIRGVSELNSNYVDTFESSEEGNRFSLPYGKYELREINAPTGYIKTEEVIEFEIKEDGEFVSVELENEKILANLELIKVSSKKKSLKLQGAEFDIYDENMNLVTSVVTNEEGIASVYDLPYGKYFYKETKAPNGYVIDENTYEFSVKESSTITITVENSPMLQALPDKLEEDNKNNIIPLPDTGGIGMIAILVSLGLVLVGAMLISSRRR